VARLARHPELNRRAANGPLEVSNFEIRNSKCDTHVSALYNARSSIRSMPNGLFGASDKPTWDLSYIHTEWCLLFDSLPSSSLRFELVDLDGVICWSDSRFQRRKHDGLR
jgi:hypothetical protein